QDKFHRALDPLAVGVFGEEMPRPQQSTHEPSDIIITLTEGISQRLQKGVGRLVRFADEEAVELPDQEARRGGPVENGGDDIVAVQVAGPAQDSLLPIIVQLRLEGEVLAAGVPAGEGTGGLADVLFRVVTDTEAEQLHHLARVVLVRLTLDIAVR